MRNFLLQTIVLIYGVSAIIFFFPKSPAWKHFFSGFFFFSVIGYYKLINLFFRETIDSAIATYFLHICSGAEGVSSWVSESFKRNIGQFCSPRNESLAALRRISSSLDFNVESFSYIKTYLLWKLWPISFKRCEPVTIRAWIYSLCFVYSSSLTVEGANKPHRTMNRQRELQVFLNIFD